MRVVATAGHVDHGKSTLVLALTGTDPDRWDEEKRRGLTIDLGFAFATLPSGEHLAFVDVPGHVRFLKNMLAGVGAVDACVFVVAATEGWKPQSEEHLRILELLGLEHGLVALTKCALVDRDTLDIRRLELDEHLAGTFLAEAPIIEVDAPTATGLDALRAALDELIRATPAAADNHRPRVWIDRVFAAKGAGTIVTGTLTGGSLAVDDELVVRPGSKTVRVRSLQSDHQTLREAGPGRRLAVNLTGVAHHELDRGHVLVRHGQFHETSTVDAQLVVLGALDHPVSRRGAYLLYVGAAEIPVKLRVLGPNPIEPGARGFVRLHLATPRPLVPGDRFVLRESGRQETVGGGEILDVDPILAAAKAQPDRSIARVIRERGRVRLDELARLTGEPVDRLQSNLDDWAVDPELLATSRSTLLDRITAAAPAEPSAPTAPGFDFAGLDPIDQAIAHHLAEEGAIVIQRGRAGIAGAAPAPTTHPYVEALDANPFVPPTPADFGIDPAELRDLVARGAVTQHDGICFSTAALDEAGRRLEPRFLVKPEGLSVAAIRDALGTSRKYVIPLVTILDRTGRTHRRGDLRVAGPRLTADGSSE